MDDTHTLLYKAVKRGDILKVRQLLASGADPNEPSLEQTPLSVAAGLGNRPIVRMLLDAGAKPGHWEVKCAAWGNHAEVVEWLLAAGAEAENPVTGPRLLDELKWTRFAPQQKQRVRELLIAAGYRDRDWREEWHWYLNRRVVWPVTRFLRNIGFMKS